MDKAPEFIFLPEESLDITQTCPIKIISGEFKDIVYRYGKISFQETENDGLNITMDIEIIRAPEGFDKQSSEFTKATGNIFVKIIEEQVDSEPSDLEADVHEERLDNS
jgi:hypothetical protein